jgi:hypothetical protein
MHRREFLRVFGLATIGFVSETVFPRKVRALETDKRYSPVVVRKGDSIYSLCRFYGLSEIEIAKNIGAITRRNQLKSPNLIVPGKIELPISEDIVNFPFKRMALQFERDRYVGLVSMTNSREAYADANTNSVMYTPDWPYTFWGHSLNANLPFHRLLRQLLDDPQKVNIWLSRSFAGEIGSWIRCRGKEEGAQYITGENDIKVAKIMWKLPFNSHNLLLGTCATEFKKQDRLVAFVTPEYNNHADPPVYGLG